MLIMISYGTFVMVFFMPSCCLYPLSLFRQASGVFVPCWWPCSPVLALLAVSIFSGWFMLYGWWLGLVSCLLLAVPILCMRHFYDTQWQIVSMLSCNYFHLFFGWAYGLVPGGAVIHDVAPSSGEQPALRAPRCTPFWPYTWDSIAMFLGCAFCWQLVLTQLKQAVVFSFCWPCHYVSMQHWWLFLLVHCWCLCVVLHCLVVHSAFCLRSYYDDSRQLIPFSLLLPCSTLWLSYGYLDGFVPGSTVLNGAAPSHGEQPIPSAPRCWPSWPTRCMTILSYPETFFDLSLNALLKVATYLLASPHSGSLYISSFNTRIDYYLVMSCFVPFLYALSANGFSFSPAPSSDRFPLPLLHPSCFIITGPCCCTLSIWTRPFLYIQDFGLHLLAVRRLVHKSLGLTLVLLYMFIFDCWVYCGDIVIVLLYYCLLAWDSVSNCSMASEGENPPRPYFRLPSGLVIFVFLHDCRLAVGIFISQSCYAYRFVFSFKALVSPCTLTYENY